MTVHPSYKMQTKTAAKLPQSITRSMAPIVSRYHNNVVDASLVPEWHSRYKNFVFISNSCWKFHFTPSPSRRQWKCLCKVQFSVTRSERALTAFTSRSELCLAILRLQLSMLAGWLPVVANKYPERAVTRNRPLPLLLNSNFMLYINTVFTTSVQPHYYRCCISRCLWWPVPEKSSVVDDWSGDPVHLLARPSRCARCLSWLQPINPSLFW